MPEKYIDINAVHIEYPETTNPYIAARTKAYQKGWNDACKSIRENAPVAEVESVKHNQWKYYVDAEGDEYDVCPECGWKQPNQNGAPPPYHRCPNCGTRMNGASSTVTQPQYESRAAVLIKIKDALIACNPHVTGITTTHSGGTAVILYDNGESRKVKIAGESLQGIAYEIFKTAIYGEKEKK